MEHHPDPRLLALLAWYRDMGVNDALADEPIDWLARGDLPLHVPPPAPMPEPQRSPLVFGDARPLKTATSAAVPVRNFAAMLPGEVESAANAAARSARTLAELRAALEAFEGCPLRVTAKNLCFYRGAAQARLMIIGEAPGREEDLEGKPFVGRAGQLLDRMLAAIGLGEPDAHITNIVYWRPPGNRTPTPQEALACRPFLLRQIEFVQPECLLLLGAAAAKHMLGVAEGITRIRGKWYEVDASGRAIPALPTLHPAYLLRTPSTKQLAWRDLLALRARLGQSQPSRATDGDSS